MRPLCVLTLAVVFACLPGCGAPAVKWSSTWDGRHAQFEDTTREGFAEARALLDSGRRVDALEQLRELAQANPDNLEIACWLQDVEAALLEDGVDVFDLPARSGEATPGDALQRAYAARANEDPSVTAYVLAARAETDLPAAFHRLETAIELDPNCAWAHYGLSHVLLQDRSRTDRWGLARDSLSRALDLEPGHLRARRLEAWMAAEQGTRDVAERLLRRWIDQAEGDPRVLHDDVVDAQLDIALLMLLRGENRRAERALEDLEGEATGRARRWMLLTVARQEGGDILGALDATLRAQGAAGGAVLPVVQEALLNELFLGRPDIANARWQEVAELVDDATSMRDQVQGLRARVRMEREAKRRALALSEAQQRADTADAR